MSPRVPFGFTVAAFATSDGPFVFSFSIVFSSPIMNASKGSSSSELSDAMLFSCTETGITALSSERAAKMKHILYEPSHRQHLGCLVLGYKPNRECLHRHHRRNTFRFATTTTKKQFQIKFLFASMRQRQMLRRNINKFRLLVFGFRFALSQRM